MNNQIIKLLYIIGTFTIFYISIYGFFTLSNAIKRCNWEQMLHDNCYYLVENLIVITIISLIAILFYTYTVDWFVKKVTKNK